MWTEPQIPPYPCRVSDYPALTGAHHLLTLLGRSPPLCEVSTQKKKVPLGCWVRGWAQLPRGTRAEDIWLRTSVGRKEWVRRKQLLALPAASEQPCAQLS